VLLIDDEEEFVSTLEERLRSRGFSAHAVTSGDQALPLMETTRFDVVVADFKLPGTGGAEILSMIKKKYPDVLTVLITGHGSGHGELEDLPEGVFEILLKPFSLDKLLEIIGKRGLLTKGKR
jgi:DNA-binding NtrC family response regulator